MITLFRKHVGGLGTWRIWAEGEVLNIAHATVIGGSEVHHKEVVELNQSGRNLDEQMALRIKSRISRMMDRGYKSSIEEANASSNTNQLGLLRPMLAHPIDKVNNVNFNGAVLQKKLDGHRCMITKRDGRLIAYSRQGKEISSIRSHILLDLEPLIPEGVTIDGELYIHGLPLQTIASYIKREQDRTRWLNFVCYDIVSDESYRDRHAEMAAMLSHVNKSVIVLPYYEYTDKEFEVNKFNEVRKEGFEGLMLRQDNFGYEEGVRSRSLCKIKAFEDAEFKVIGVVASSVGWAICKCITDSGKIFDVSAPGTVPEKRYVLEHIEEFIDRKLKVQFANYTVDGIPFQPVALEWYSEI